MLELALIAFLRLQPGEGIIRYGNSGQPCQTPLCNLKKLLDHPLFKTRLLVLLYIKRSNPFFKKLPNPK